MSELKEPIAIPFDSDAIAKHLCDKIAELQENVDYYKQAIRAIYNLMANGQMELILCHDEELEGGLISEIFTWIKQKRNGKDV